MCECRTWVCGGGFFLPSFLNICKALSLSVFPYHGITVTFLKMIQYKLMCWKSIVLLLLFNWYQRGQIHTGFGQNLVMKPSHWITLNGKVMSSHNVRTSPSKDIVECDAISTGHVSSTLHFGSVVCHCIHLYKCPRQILQIPIPELLFICFPFNPSPCRMHPIQVYVLLLLDSKFVYLLLMLFKISLLVAFSVQVLSATSLSTYQTRLTISLHPFSTSMPPLHT